MYYFKLFNKSIKTFYYSLFIKKIQNKIYLDSKLIIE